MDEDVFLQYTTGVDARQTAVEWELAWSGMSEGYCTLGLCGLCNSMMRLTLTWGCVGKWGVCGLRQHAHAKFVVPMDAKSSHENESRPRVLTTYNCIRHDKPAGHYYWKTARKKNANNASWTLSLLLLFKFCALCWLFLSDGVIRLCGGCWFCFYFCLVATEKMYGNVVTNVDVLADYDKHDT